MADMMWAGRFSKKVDETVNAFNSSIAFDGRMYKQDIQGSIAHAAMLGDCGIISKEDSLAIIGGLKEILADIENGTLEFDMTAEDIHMFIEAELTKRLGDVGKRLHTSRSRNDQVAVDIRLYLRQEIDEIYALVKELAVTIYNLAKEPISFNIAPCLPIIMLFKESLSTIIVAFIIALSFLSMYSSTTQVTACGTSSSVNLSTFSRISSDTLNSIVVFVKSSSGKYLTLSGK